MLAKVLPRENILVVFGSELLMLQQEPLQEAKSSRMSTVLLIIMTVRARITALSAEANLQQAWLTIDWRTDRRTDGQFN